MFFFVISGFLITNIIVHEVTRGDFSIARFYERRIRRIFPALFVVLAVTLAAVLYLYNAQAQRDFGKSLTAATLFYSNIFFWTQSGYFDPGAQSKPLLHTWSLAVEEQYYIIYPLALASLLRRYKPHIKNILAAAIALSFAAGLYTLQKDPTAAFYFTHLRAWELFIGGLIAFLPPFRSTRPVYPALAALAGLAMILLPIFLYTDNTPFPGMAAAAPVFGTAWIIYLNGATFVHKLLGSKPLAFIGKISYSLYLWHWPAILFVNYYAIRKLSRVEHILLVIGIVGISTLSWLFVEQPFRKASKDGQRKVFSAAAISMAASILAAVFVSQFNRAGLQTSLGSTPSAFEEQFWKYEICNFTGGESEGVLKICKLGNESSQASFLVWGDSHAGSLSAGIELSASKFGLTGQLAFAAGCPPLQGIAANKRSPCPDFNQQVLNYISDHKEIKIVFLTGRWSVFTTGKGYKESTTYKLIDTWQENSKKKFNPELVELGLERTISELIAQGREVILISQIPEIKYDVPPAMYIAQKTGRDVNSIIAPTAGEYADRARLIQSIFNNLAEKYPLQIIDPSTILCASTRCIVETGGKALYGDANHLSPFGSEYISSLYDPIFQTMTQGNQ